MEPFTLLSIDQLDDLAAERDVRTDRGSLDELACSLIAHGLITPLTVVPDADTGRYTINAGHRRRAALRRAVELLQQDPEEFGCTAEQAAARAAELTEQVPCWVRPDLAGRESLTQLAENGETRRGLSDAERYRGLQMAFADGLADREIAQVSGMKMGQVRTARKADRLPESAQEAIATGQLDLDTAAELDKFRDDPKATERILKKFAQSPQQIPYVLAEEQHKRDRAAAAERLKAEAIVAGHTVRAEPRGGLTYGHSHIEELFDHLTHPDGTPLTPQADGGEEGHYVFIERAYTGPQLRYFCGTPDEHGHARTRRTHYRSPAEVARLEAEREAEDQQRAAMRAAVTVRGKFLRGLIGSQKAASKHLDLATAIAAQFPGMLLRNTNHQLADELMPDLPESWNPARLTHYAVARAVLGIDTTADGTVGWRSDASVALWWWHKLAELGYQRGDAENIHVAALEEAAAAEEAREAAREARAAADAAAAADADNENPTAAGDIDDDAATADDEAQTWASPSENDETLAAEIGDPF